MNKSNNSYFNFDVESPNNHTKRLWFKIKQLLIQLFGPKHKGTNIQIYIIIFWKTDALNAYHYKSKVHFHCLTAFLIPYTLWFFPHKV